MARRARHHTAPHPPHPRPSAYDRKWEIDEQAQLDYLDRLPLIADHAVLTAIGRWRESQSREPGVDATEAFARVGIRITDREERPRDS